MLPDDEIPPRVVLYDGVCALCNWLVRALVRADRARVLAYAPLQGETAARLRAAHPSIPDDIDTAVLVDEGRVFLRSRAIFATCRHLGWPWRAFAILGRLPAAWTDLGYRAVARVRYRVFGKFDACRIPTTDERARFLP
jgi:predicted DCC family thiol-disulfide oxidoreductase YuxK